MTVMKWLNRRSTTIDFKDVTDNLEIPALPTPQKRALTKEEENALKKVDFTLKQKTFVNLLRYTGIRRGEALGLMQSDIDLEEMKLSVNRQVAFDKKGWPYLTDPKWKSFRTIDIPDILKSTLEEYLKTLICTYSQNRTGSCIQNLHSEDFGTRLFAELILQLVDMRDQEVGKNL